MNFSKGRATSKKANFRHARKRATRWSSDVTQDSMKASRRNYGQGLSK